MIERFNGNIALYLLLCLILLLLLLKVESSSLEVKQKIQLEVCINESSTLCVFNENSFVYGCKDIFFQISNEGGSILFYSKGRFLNNWYGFLLEYSVNIFKEYFSRYHRGIILLIGGKYFAISNCKKLSIFKLCYA